jgi:hypothetical protein
MNDTDADFLKRKNRFDPDLGQIVGMLDENSIFKSLHSSLASKECTPEEVSAQNIDGALREWFFHGRAVFEQRQAEMKRVVDMTNVMPVEVNKSFDDRVEDWKSKYSPQSGSKRSFAPFEGGVPAPCVLGHSVMDNGRRYEYLFVGRGVFVSTKNIGRFKTLVYNDQRYAFEEFVPEYDSLLGIITVYYVRELSHLASPVEYSAHAITTRCFMDRDVAVRLRPAVFKGREGDQDIRDNAILEAKSYGLSKFSLPSGPHFDYKDFMNQGVSLLYKGKQYPALLSYHRYQDSSRSNSAGSVRMVSHDTFSKTLWIKV